MRKFGLVGFPLGHSFSKKYFSDRFLNESLPDCIYSNYEIKGTDQINELLENDPEIVGLNVTIPYKSEIINYIDVIDNEALDIGAVNVLKISRSGGKRLIKGFNTDLFGFRESLIASIGNRHIRRAVILGSGGSSKAVVYALKRLGADIIQVSRKIGPGTILYEQLTGELISEVQLIVNTTPVGMFPLISEKPVLKYEYLNSDHILFDLVYNPLKTEFLKKGEERGALTINGLPMLHLQAEKSWEIWNNPDI